MRTIIVNEHHKQVLEKCQVLNESLNLYSFISHIKGYIKRLLKDPVYAKTDDFLKEHGLGDEKLLQLLKDNNIIVKNERIDTSDGKDKFVISYKVPKDNFKRKLKRLYSQLYEKNIVESTILKEEGEGAVGMGGATSADSSGQFSQPLFSEPLRRQKTVYLTKNQVAKLQNEAVEMGTNFGDFGYDAPPFKKKKDPAYNHKNMLTRKNGNEV